MTETVSPFAALTVKIFSVYMMLLGCCMMLLPEPLFAIVQLPLGDGVPFVRSLGMVVFLFGTQYWVAGVHRTASFIRVSVYTRMGAVGILVLMTLLHWVHCRWPSASGRARSCASRWAWRSSAGSSRASCSPC